MPDAFPACAAVDACSSLCLDGHAPAERLRSHYASPADMAARFGLQEMIGLAPLPDSDTLDACCPPVFAEEWPRANLREAGQEDGEQPPAYDVERVAAALDQASREADSYLAVRLPVPLDTTAGVPQPLRAFVCDMARYHLTAGFGMQVAEDVAARYRAALAWLRDVAKGAAEIVVPTPPGAPEPQPPETGVEFALGCHDHFF